MAPTCSCTYRTWPSSEAVLSGGLLQRAVYNVKCLCYINIIYSDMYLGTAASNCLLEKMTAYQTCPVL